MTAVVNVSATTSDVSGSVPVAFSMTIAFLPSPCVLDVGDLGDDAELAAGGSGLNSRIP